MIKHSPDGREHYSSTTSLSLIRAHPRTVNCGSRKTRLFLRVVNTCESTEPLTDQPEIKKELYNKMKE